MTSALIRPRPETVSPAVLRLSGLEGSLSAPAIVAVVATDSPHFRKVAGIGDGWTPRELRTSFVNLLSHSGVGIEEIARLAGHASTRTTEVVYRRELQPVITT
jgi:integrase